MRRTPPSRAAAALTLGLVVAAGIASGRARAAGPEPDFGYFREKIEPVLEAVCSQCHAGKGQGQFALIANAPGARIPEADSRKNFETVKKLLVAGKPEQSKFLLKPLAERDGGAKHGGGDRIFRGSAAYRAWVDFIRGVQSTAAAPAGGETVPGPALPPEGPAAPEPPVVGEKGLVLEAEAMEIAGGARLEDAPGASGRVVAPGPGGGRLRATFRASRRAHHGLALRIRGAVRGLRVRIDDGEALDVDVPAEGMAEVSPGVPLDGGKPLDARRGRLETKGPPADPVLAMDGREGIARWLSPADLPHDRVRAVLGFPAEEEPGRDDAWLLFDCIDADNGKFFGLSDGGRRLVMGVIEAGRPRVLRAEPAPALPADAAIELGVDLLDGVAVGRVNAKPVLFVHFDRGLGAARFGFLTHGVAVVRSLAAARGAQEVHRTRFGAGGVFPLSKGLHRLEIDLLPQGAALDAVTVKEVPE